VVVHRRQRELLEVVDALRAAGRLARRLDGGQEQGDQHGDDRDHHQQLDQREASTGHRRAHRHTFLEPEDRRFNRRPCVSRRTCALGPTWVRHGRLRPGAVLAGGEKSPANRCKANAEDLGRPMGDYRGHPVPALRRKATAPCAAKHPRGARVVAIHTSEEEGMVRDGKDKPDDMQAKKGRGPKFFAVVAGGAAESANL